jgi:FG-GAP-like repeat
MKNWSDFLHLPVFLNRIVIFFLLTASLFAFAVTPHTSTVQFQSATSYGVGPTPNSVATADLNGDGRLDLAVSNLSGTISILFGNGDGSFQAANTFTAGTRISSVTATDLNGDSKPDLVILDVTSSGGRVGFLLNNGDGTFGTVQLLPGIADASSFTTGDVDGDLKTDILVGDRGTTPLVPVVAVFHGNGDGTFHGLADVTLPGPPGTIYLTDINLDGRLDLTMSLFSAFSVRFGNGDGTFQSPLFISTGSFSTTLAGDLNQDGKADLVVFGSNLFSHNNFFVTRLGNGDGTFQLAVSNGSSSGTLSLLADFDGDTVPDVGAQASGSVFLWINQGDSTFQPVLTASAGATSAGMTAADLNGDGATDLVVTNPAQNTVSVLLNTGTQISLNSVLLNPSIISRGQSATANVVVNLLNSFVKPVALSCQVAASGQSQGAVPACSIQPSVVTPGANASATAKLTVSTSASFASLFPGLSRVLLSLAVVCFGFLVLSRNSSSKRRLILLAATGGLALQAACGGGKGTPPPPQPSIYTVTVSATAASAHQSTSTTLTVQ